MDPSLMSWSAAAAQLWSSHLAPIVLQVSVGAAQLYLNKPLLSILASPFIIATSWGQPSTHWAVWVGILAVEPDVVALVAVYYVLRPFRAVMSHFLGGLLYSNHNVYATAAERGLRLHVFVGYIPDILRVIRWALRSIFLYKRTASVLIFLVWRLLGISPMDLFFSYITGLVLCLNLLLHAPYSNNGSFLLLLFERMRRFTDRLEALYSVGCAPQYSYDPLDEPNKSIRPLRVNFRYPFVEPTYSLKHFH